MSEPKRDNRFHRVYDSAGNYSNQHVLTSEVVERLNSCNPEEVQYLKCRVYAGDELLGESFNTPALIVALFHGYNQWDLHSDVAGGSVPVDLATITRFEWYVG